MNIVLDDLREIKKFKKVDSHYKRVIELINILLEIDSLDATNIRQIRSMESDFKEMLDKLEKRDIEYLSSLISDSRFDKSSLKNEIHTYCQSIKKEFRKENKQTRKNRKNLYKFRRRQSSYSSHFSYTDDSLDENYDWDFEYNDEDKYGKKNYSSNKVYKISIEDLMGIKGQSYNFRTQYRRISELLDILLEINSLDASSIGRLISLESDFKKTLNSLTYEDGKYLEKIIRGSSFDKAFLRNEIHTYCQSIREKLKKEAKKEKRGRLFKFKHKQPSYSWRSNPNDEFDYSGHSSYTDDSLDENYDWDFENYDEEEYEEEYTPSFSKRSREKGTKKRNGLFKFKAQQSSNGLSHVPTRKFNYDRNSLSDKYPPNKEESYTAGYVSAGTPSNKIESFRIISPSELASLEMRKNSEFDYISVVNVVENITGQDIIKKFGDSLIRMRKGCPDSLYVMKTTRLIDKTISSLTINPELISKELQENFCLEIPQGVDASKFIKEIIGDELRYYQQEFLQKNPNESYNLGNSRLILKSANPFNNGMGSILYYERHDNGKNDMTYRFNKNLIERNYFSIHASSRQKLSYEYVNEKLMGKLFGLNTDEVKIEPIGDDQFTVVANEKHIGRSR